jgi:hypothetical protein
MLESKANSRLSLVNVAFLQLNCLCWPQFKELDKTLALKEGAEFVGEAFIFSVAASFVMLFEVDKYYEKKKKR